MPTKANCSIAQQMQKAEHVIFNALSSKDIMKLLSDYGYDSARIKEGKRLFDSAAKAVQDHKMLMLNQHDQTARMVQVSKVALDAYQSLSKVSRAVWNKERSKLEALGIHGKLTTSTAGFIANAYVLFDNALTNPELAGVLNDYGYTREKLTAERVKIAEMERFHQEQVAVKEAAYLATRMQQQALNELAEWVARFIKIAKVALRDKREHLAELGLASVKAATGKPAGPGRNDR